MDLKGNRPKSASIGIRGTGRFPAREDTWGGDLGARVSVNIERKCRGLAMERPDLGRQVVEDLARVDEVDDSPGNLTRCWRLLR